MTTLVYRDGILAADRIMLQGSIKCAEFSKIAKAPNGAIGGAAGDLKGVRKFLDWIQAGATGVPPVSSKAEGYVIFTSERLFSWDGVPTLTEVFAPFLAVGSGWEVALGALAMGADARRAVEIAAQFDANSGGGIDILTLEREQT